MNIYIYSLFHPYKILVVSPQELYPLLISQSTSRYDFQGHSATAFLVHRPGAGKHYSLQIPLV